MENKKLIIAAIPRTGSTFMARTLSKVLFDSTKWRYARFAYGPKKLEYSPVTFISYFPTRSLYSEGKRFYKGHMWASPLLMESLGRHPWAKVVFMVRNIRDIIPSLVTHHDYLSEGNLRRHWPHWIRMTIAEKYDALIDIMIPNFVAMYAGWERLYATGLIPVCKMHYEQWCGDNRSGLQTILDFIGEDCEISDEHFTSKKNEHRPYPPVTKEQYERIYRLTQHFPGVSFEGFIDEP